MLKLIQSSMACGRKKSPQTASFVCELKYVTVKFDQFLEKPPGQSMAKAQVDKFSYQIFFGHYCQRLATIPQHL